MINLINRQFKKTDHLLLSIIIIPNLLKCSSHSSTEPLNDKKGCGTKMNKIDDFQFGACFLF